MYPDQSFFIAVSTFNFGAYKIVNYLLDGYSPEQAALINAIIESSEAAVTGHPNEIIAILPFAYYQYRVETSYGERINKAITEIAELSVYYMIIGRLLNNDHPSPLILGHFMLAPFYSSVIVSAAVSSWYFMQDTIDFISEELGSLSVTNSEI